MSEKTLSRLPICDASLKVKHPSRRSARRHLKKLKGVATDAHLLEVYRCVYCELFHVGHNNYRRNDDE